jgi:hypothetical protein
VEWHSGKQHAETDNVHSLDVLCLQPMHNHVVSPTTCCANKLSHCPMSTANGTWNELVSNSGLPKDRSVNYRLSHCTALILRDGLSLKHGNKSPKMFHLQMKHVTHPHTSPKPSVCLSWSLVKVMLRKGSHDIQQVLLSLIQCQLNDPH